MPPDASPHSNCAPLILASTSPRRCCLLEEYGFAFEVISPNVPEISGHALPAERLVRENAHLKALAVARAHPARVVVAADTVVAFNERIFGKPDTFEEAEWMLEQLNGKEHSVHSGVCTIHLDSGQKHVFTETTRVRFRELPCDARRSYLLRINPLDKAGAYAAQDDHGELIESFFGSFTNVIGLPMETLTAHLQAFGIKPCSRKD